MRSLINILLLIAPLTLFAQNADSLKKVVPKEKVSYRPTGIRVGADLISFIRTATEDDFSGYEFNADIDFYRYYLTAEAGRWEKNFSNEAEDYNNSGTYARIGVDVNFLLKDPDKNMFFFGARYATGTYSENFTVVTNDPVWGIVETSYANADVQARWGELTTGLRVKMWKFFWMGYTARLKFGLHTNQPPGLFSYDVPGYGRVDEDTMWGFNYQILFRIPLKKEKQVKTD